MFVHNMSDSKLNMKTNTTTHAVVERVPLVRGPRFNLGTCYIKNKTKTYHIHRCIALHIQR